MTRTELRAEALKLPETHRLELAAELLESVENGPPLHSDDDPAWVAELERRAQAALEGAPTFSWGEVRRSAEENLTAR